MKKTIFITAFLTAFTGMLSAQKADTNVSTFDIPKNLSYLTDTNYVYTFVQAPAQYPGGEAALAAFVEKNIVYPPLNPRVTGRVLLKFVVDERGKVQGVKIIKGVVPALDNEAIRVIKLLPDFTPGIQQGKAVKTYYHLPVVFK